MNPFSLNHKKPEKKIAQRLKIKSKYFGEYEPEVFIASKSKSKSRSTSKDEINNLMTKKFPLNYQTFRMDGQSHVNKAQKIIINPQASRSGRSFNSGNLSEYLLSRNTNARRNKSGSAIQKIIEWVERRYFERISNCKIDHNTPLSFVSDNKFAQTNEKYKFQELFKKFAYDAFIISRLKRTALMELNFQSREKESVIKKNQDRKYESKENDIDNIDISPIKQVSKAEDFDIYKFKKNPNYSTEVNQMRVSQLSIDNINRSGYKTASNQHLPDKEQFASSKHKFDIPTMNTLQNLDAKEGAIESQKNVQIGKIQFQSKAFFVETARSTSTNQVMELSKNSLLSNSMTEKQQLINTKQVAKSGPLYKGDLMVSIDIKNESEDTKIKVDEQLAANSKSELKTADNFKFVLNKKLRCQTAVCDSDYWLNSLFHPESLSTLIKPMQTNAISTIDEPSEQILNQIFQMNHDQQHILNIIANQFNSRIFVSNKTQKTSTIQKPQSIIDKIHPNKDSQTSNSRKSFAKNYFTMHLAPYDQPNSVKTYQMPLVKANTNLKLKMTQNNQSNQHLTNHLSAQNNSSQKPVFTFNSLSPQNPIKTKTTTKKKVSLHAKKMQTNAFVQNCNIFSLCSGESQKQLVRTNYFTEIQTQRQRGISVNSNQSKASSKAKVSFNYISPSSKNINAMEKQKDGQSSILFRGQISNLKNMGHAPVKIQIKPSRERKSNEKVQQSTLKQVVPFHAKQLRSQINTVQHKQTSHSVPHFTGQKVVFSNQLVKMEPNKQIGKVGSQQKKQTKKGFISAGYGPSYYYQSQKIILNNVQSQGKLIQENYQSAQSYYFPAVQSHVENAQIITNNSQPKSSKNILSKKKQLSPHRNDNRYLYPIQQSVQKQRNQRAKSLCQKIIVTVKNKQC